MSDQSFWWQAPEGEAHDDVMEYVRGLEESQKYIHELNLRNARLYANCDLAGLDWTLNRRDYSRRSFGRVSENVIASVIDTATSMIARTQPRAAFMTDGADWSTQRKAKGLEKFVEGQFQRLEVYKQGPRMFRDAGIFGSGFFKVLEEDGEPCIERTLTDEIIVDELECRSCPPRQMHQRQFVNREVLQAMFPDFEDEIENAAKEEGAGIWTSYRKVESGQIPVVESWHLPSGRVKKSGKTDGRHTICVKGATLFDEKWTKECFPFVKYDWSEPLVGFYGQGLAEQLTGIQVRINKLNKYLEMARDLVSVPRLFVGAVDSRIKAQLTNEIGQVIVTKSGKPPTFFNPMQVGADWAMEKEQLKKAAYELAGISQLSASSKKPGGIESAVALREYNDIETARFAIQAQRYEHVFLELARRIVEVAKDLYSEGRSLKSTWRGKRFIETIDWKQVDMDQDAYLMNVEAASIMSRTPAGRRQAVVELGQMGLIDTDEARRLSGIPDLERTMSLANAGIEDIEATIEDLLDGKFVVPEPEQNLQLGIVRVQMALLKAKRDDAPEDILQAMRDWMEQAKFLLAGPPPDQQIPPEATGMPPEAATAQPGMMPPGEQPPMGAPMPGQPSAAFAPSAMNIAPSTDVVG